MDKLWDGDSTIVLLLKFKWAEVIPTRDLYYIRRTWVKGTKVF